MNPEQLESAVDDFISFLLGFLRFNEPERKMHQSINYPFWIGAEQLSAKVNICVEYEGTNISILAVENKVRCETGGDGHLAEYNSSFQYDESQSGVHQPFLSHGYWIYVPP